jgi:hypothetical protein
MLQEYIHLIPRFKFKCLCFIEQFFLNMLLYCTFRATTNRKLKETVALELSFVNSNLQLLKEQLAELNSSVELYQNER